MFIIIFGKYTLERGGFDMVGLFFLKDGRVFGVVVLGGIVFMVISFFYSFLGVYLD